MAILDFFWLKFFKMSGIKIDSLDKKVNLCRSIFGKYKNCKTGSEEIVEKFTWKTVNRLEIALISFGATLTSIKAPDRNGNVADILLGFDDLEKTLLDDKCFFGSTFGRVSGLVKNGEYCMKGKYYQCPKNFKKKHMKNGGALGFHKVNWLPTVVNETDVVLSHVSEHMTNGFPGNLLVQIVFSVSANNNLKISMSARSNLETPVNLSNRLYFNLASHDSGKDELLDHIININSSKVCMNCEGIFKKKSLDVGLTDYNLRVPTTISDKIDKIPDGTFNHLYIIDGDPTPNTKKSLQFVSRIIYPSNGRVLEIFSNQPTVHFSTCAHFPEEENVLENPDEELPKTDSMEYLTLDYLRQKLTDKEIRFFKCQLDTDSLKLSQKINVSEENICLDLNKILNEDQDDEVSTEPIKGKDESIYTKNCGFFLECQHFPNAVNHQRQYPDIILKPGMVYENNLLLKFGIHIFYKKTCEPELFFPYKVPYYNTFPTSINIL